ncbi:INO80 complex subunit B [Dimargaris verticillata]|uniref:INO80 complex subunit B n=1 Tax=Dimargaris verticillata TaxID=2761393 RepID=A0A9W8B9Q5_9FUNG|nr:INO80 complex subunit B [Dimargaris verticillata]
MPASVTGSDDGNDSPVTPKRSTRLSRRSARLGTQAESPPQPTRSRRSGTRASTRAQTTGSQSAGDVDMAHSPPSDTSPRTRLRTRASRNARGDPQPPGSESSVSPEPARRSGTRRATRNPPTATSAAAKSRAVAKQAVGIETDSDDDNDNDDQATPLERADAEDEDDKVAMDSPSTTSGHVKVDASTEDEDEDENEEDGSDGMDFDTGSVQKESNQIAEHRLSGDEMDVDNGGTDSGENSEDQSVLTGEPVNDSEVEVEGEEEDIEFGNFGSDDEAMQAMSTLKQPMTKRQRAMVSSDRKEELLELPQESKRKNLTEEEIALRRSENTRRRKFQSMKRIEQDQADTINRLLKKQASKRSKKDDADQETSANEAVEPPTDIRLTVRPDCTYLQLPPGCEFVSPVAQTSYPSTTPSCSFAGCPEPKKYTHPAKAFHACSLAHYQRLMTL